MNRDPAVSRPIASITFAFLFMLFVPTTVFAYVFPYPSYMPGHRLYPISRILDGLKHYWYWGTLGQLRYHRELSDKYFVEGKTLWEYGQYLLGTDALVRSEEHFTMLSPRIAAAKGEGKWNSELQARILDAASARREATNLLKRSIPQTLVWTEEKSEPIELRIHKTLDRLLESVSDVEFAANRP